MVGHIDLERFAADNDIAYQTLKNRSSQRKKRLGQSWPEWKRSILDTAQAEADRLVSRHMATEIAAMNEKHFRAAELGLAVAARKLRKSLADAGESGEVTMTAKDVRALMGTLKDAQAMQRTAKELPAERLGVGANADETWVATIDSGGMGRVRQATSIEGDGQEPITGS